MAGVVVEGVCGPWRVKSGVKCWTWGRGGMGRLGGSHQGQDQAVCEFLTLSLTRSFCAGWVHWAGRVKTPLPNPPSATVAVRY